MKTKLIFLIFLISFALNAVPFKSYFGSEFNKWYILYDVGNCPNTFSYLTCAGRTTIIDGKPYQFLYEIYEGLYDTINSLPVNTVSDKYLREDKITGRLYYRYKIYSDYGTSYSPETLVSDLSLSIGDSISLNVKDVNLSYWTNLKLSTSEHKYYAFVDSVYFKDGLKHVRTTAHFNTNEEYLFEKSKTALTFIEGTGSNLSPVLDYNHMAYASNIWKLMCNVQDNITTHFNTSGFCRIYLICDGGGAGVGKIYDNQMFSIRLSAENINISFTSTFSGTVRLTQSTGMVVNETRVENLTEHKVNAEHLPGGIYILQTINYSGTITTEKIILP